MYVFHIPHGTAGVAGVLWGGGGGEGGGAELRRIACGKRTGIGFGFVHVGVLQGARQLGSGQAYPRKRVSSFPGFISAARGNDQRSTDFTRVL